MASCIQKQPFNFHVLLHGTCSANYFYITLHYVLVKSALPKDSNQIFQTPAAKDILSARLPELRYREILQGLQADVSLGHFDFILHPRHNQVQFWLSQRRKSLDYIPNLSLTNGNPWNIILTMGPILRKEYFERLRAYKDKHIIKVVTGIRRCGKSMLLKMFRGYLLESGIEEKQIIFLNFEDFDNYDLLSPKNLYDYVKSRIVQDKMTYVFFDEIQNVTDFQRVVDSLFLNENVDLYLTGSNAYLLSGELATLLSGRYITIEMLPFSFKEFSLALGENSNLSKAEKYRLYVQKTSFPYALNLGDDRQEILDYLSGVYSTVVLKDVVSRHKITDAKMLESVVRFVFDSIGSPLSSKKIADTMTSSGRKIDSKTVEKYLTALGESFIIYEAKRYDAKGKEYLKLLEKYYAVDVGLRFMLLGQRANDVGHILENIVYLELIRRGFKVFVGKVDDAEIDFVAQNQEGNTYIQVAATCREETTLQRELRPLKALKDNYPKLLLTLDEDPVADYEGIKRMNALDWLLSTGE